MIRAAVLMSVLAFCASAQQGRAVQEFWMRSYPQRQFSSIWSLDLSVSDGPKARAKILSAMEKSGGTLTHPLESFPADAGFKHQQMSYTVAKAGAEKALRQFRGLGKIRRLAKVPDGTPDFSDEIKAKLKALSGERKMGAAQLAQLPSSRAAVDEIVAHLEAALSARERSADKILLNIAVEESSAGKK